MTRCSYVIALARKFWADLLVGEVLELTRKIFGYASKSDNAIFSKKN